jgi:hypothetical protein
MSLAMTEEPPQPGIRILNRPSRYDGLLRDDRELLVQVGAWVESQPRQYAPDRVGDNAPRWLVEGL